MYAEIEFRAKGDLPRNLAHVLAGAFPSDVGPEEAFSRTSIEGGFGSWETRVVHAQLAHRRATVFFRMDARTLLLHLEHDNPNTAIGDLRQHIDRAVPQVERLLEDGGTAVEALRFEVLAEGKPIQRGERLGWRARIMRGLREDAFPKIYVPLATLTASLIFGGLRQASYAVLVAIVALALYLVVQASLPKDPYDVRTVD